MRRIKMLRVLLTVVILCICFASCSDKSSSEKYKDKVEKIQEVESTASSEAQESESQEAKQDTTSTDDSEKVAETTDIEYTHRQNANSPDDLEQAKDIALNYMSISNMSRKLLLEQLEWEGFSTETASSAIDELVNSGEIEFFTKCYNWGSHLIENHGESKQLLYNELINTGFSEEEVAYAFDLFENVDQVNWSLEAVQRAEEFLLYNRSDYTREEMISTLTYINGVIGSGFTQEEAEFACDKLGILE